MYGYPGVGWVSGDKIRGPVGSWKKLDIVISIWHELNLIITLLFGECNGTPLQYSCLENPMDGRAWWAAIHGVTKSRTRLSDFIFTSYFHALKKEMATQSSVLAWRIPGTGEPGGLQSMGSHRVRHYWSDLAAATLLLMFNFMPKIILK